jgi:predicted enzyme related to lactoylglutathione lyase
LRVGDFEKAMKDSERRGSRPEKGPLEIPNGRCAVLKDPSGNEFAIFQDVRPNVFVE